MSGLEPNIPNLEPSEADSKTGICIGNVGRDLNVGGDIVAGNKTVIQNIIQHTAQRIVTAPYKFLASYDISDQDIFFGRSAAIEELAGKIPRYKAMIISGQSGSGKTSLIKAGLIPRLTMNGYFFVYFLDYIDPIRQLREYFNSQEEFRLEGPERPTDSLSLLQILQMISRRQESRVVIVLDQFERFFVNVHPALRGQFIQLLKECMESDLSADKMNFVFSIRQDFFGQLVSEFEAVMPRFFQESGRYHLQPLSRDEAREAIVKPLQSIPNIGYDLKFVDEILLPALIGKAADSGQMHAPTMKAAGSAQIEPHHLQIVCNCLYEAARAKLKDGGVVEIDRKLYTESGEAEGILQGYLDRCVEQISRKDPGKMNIVRSMLKLMIETTGTRKFVSLTEIQHGLPDVKEARLIEEIIRSLQDERVVDTCQKGETTGYSLSHEVMVKKVQEWLDEREIHRRQAQETLKRGLAEWKTSQTLLNKKQVRLIRTWIIALSEEEEKLLNASQKSCRRYTIRICVLLVILLAATGVLLFRDSQERKMSSSLKLAALAAQALDTDPSVSFRLAEAALHISPILNAQKAILPALEYAFYHVLEGHRSDVTMVVFSPDGRYVATASHDKTARIWNVVGGQQTHLLEGHTDSISRIAFSRDGKLIVTSSYDKTARIWDAATGKQLHVLAGHADFVSYAEFSPNSEQVVTASWDKTARIWDVATGRQIRLLDGHTDAVSSAAFSPDGVRLATASGDNTVCLWDVASGERRSVLKGHTASVISVAFSPGGARLATASYDHTARIWDAVTGQTISILTGHADSVVQAAFSPDGKFMVTSSYDHTARIWEVDTGQQLYALKGHTDPVTHAEFSPDAKFIITSSGDNTARIWDAGTGQQISVLKGHIAAVLYAAFSPDGKQLVTASKDNTVRIWSAAVGQYIHVLKEHTDVLSASMFSPDAKRMVTTSCDDEAALIWDIATGQECHVLKGHEDSVLSAEFSPDGEQVVTASRDGTARIWNAATGSQVHVLAGHGHPVMNASFSPDGKLIVTASRDVRIWDAVTGREIRLLNGHSNTHDGGHADEDTNEQVDRHTDGHDYERSDGHESGHANGNNDAHDGYDSDSVVKCAMFSPNGKLMVTTSWDKILVWDADTGRELQVLQGQKGPVSSVMFSPDGRLIISTSEEETSVRIWNSKSVQEIRILKGHTDLVKSALFSPDGELAVTASWDKTVRIWKVSTGQQLHVLAEHTDIVSSAQFSPDGKRVLSASEDNTARIWDVATGQQIHVLKGHTAGIESAMFSPDGKRVITASKDNTVRIWPGNYQEALKLINEDKIRGKVRELSHEEKITYGIIKP